MEVCKLVLPVHLFWSHFPRLWTDIYLHSDQPITAWNTNIFFQPGEELWKRVLAVWLLNTAMDQCPSDVTDILTAAEHNADVMAASLEYLLHAIHHDSTCFDDGLWLHIAVCCYVSCASYIGVLPGAFLLRTLQLRVASHVAVAAV